MKEGYHYVGPYRVPIGFRFAPTDDELALHFLRPWALGQDVLPGLVRHLDVYQYHPADLLADAPTRKAYFFTELKPMYKSGDKSGRTAGNGFWRISRMINRIYDSDGTEVACKRLLVYHEKEGRKSFKTDWLMHEYTLLDSNKVKALCEVYLKNGKAMKDSSEAYSTSGRDEATVQATSSNYYDLVAMSTDPSHSSGCSQEMRHLAQSPQTCFSFNIPLQAPASSLSMVVQSQPQASHTIPSSPDNAISNFSIPDQSLEHLQAPAGSLSTVVQSQPQASHTIPSSPDSAISSFTPVPQCADPLGAVQPFQITPMAPEMQPEQLPVPVDSQGCSGEFILPPWICDPAEDDLLWTLPDGFMDDNVFFF